MGRADPIQRLRSQYLLSGDAKYANVSTKPAHKPQELPEVPMRPRKGPVRLAMIIKVDHVVNYRLP